MADQSSFQPPLPPADPFSQNVLQQDLKQSQYDVAPVAAHTHNGTDSLQVNPNDLTGANLYFAVRKVVLTSADILDLNATPVTLVPAFGRVAAARVTNSVIIVEGITARLYFGGTAYTGAQNLEFRYTNGAGIKVTADLASTFINSGADAYGHVAGIVTAFAPVANAPIVVRVPTASPATGNGTIVFSVKYRVVTL